MSVHWFRVLLFAGTLAILGSKEAAAQSKLPNSSSRPKVVQSKQRQVTSGFKDISAGHWAAPGVTRMVARGIMNGRPDGTFQGDKPVTRYELAVALDRFVRQTEAALKKSGEAFRASEPNPDPKASLNIPKGHWAYDAIARLVSSGYLPGSSPIVIGPGQHLTIEQIGEAFASVAIRLTDLISHEPYEREGDAPGSPRSDRAVP